MRNEQSNRSPRGNRGGSGSGNSFGSGNRTPRKSAPKGFTKKSEMKGWNKKSGDEKEVDYRYAKPGSKGKDVELGKKPRRNSNDSESNFRKSSDDKPRKSYTKSDSGSYVRGEKPEGRFSKGPRTESSEGRNSRSYDSRPSKSGSTTGRFSKREGSDSERPRAPYKSDRPYSNREGSSSERPRAPYRKREEGDSYKSDRPYSKREGSSPDRPRTPYKKREDGDSYKSDRPYAKREGSSSDRPRAPYRKREEGDSFKSDRPYSPRTSSSSDRPSRYSDKKGDGERTYGSNRGSYSRDNEGRSSSYGDRRGTSGYQKRDTDFSKSKERAKEKEQKAPKKTAESDLELADGIRLNRYISNAGICSRREADDLIGAGLVSINDVVVTELGSKVKSGDVVKFNGSKLSVEEKVYLLLNKPKDTITTFEDGDGRNTVMELFEGKLKERVFPVGRLDRNTTGLLVLTNDGEMAQRLMHPKYEVHKVYKATLDKPLRPTDLWTLSNGVELEDGVIKPDAIAQPDPKNKEVVGIEIHSGKNRIIHRMFEHLGYKVDKLDRVLYADLEKGKLKRGEWRELTEKEIKGLKRLCKLK
jgi:23S rRNA pseudouridine2605 synthase